MSETNKVNFKSSKVKTKENLDTKANQDKYRKLHTDYEQKFKELEETVQNIKKILQTSGTAVEYNSIISIDDIGAIIEGPAYKLAKLYKDKLEAIKTIFLNDSHSRRKREAVLEKLESEESLETIIYNISLILDDNWIRNRLDYEGLKSLLQDMIKENAFVVLKKYDEIIDIYNVLQNFYKVYGEILNMDTRTPGEKTETAAEYAQEVLAKIKLGDTEIINKVATDGASYISGIFEASKTNAVDGFTWLMKKAGENIQYSSTNFQKFLYERFTSEDQKEIDQELTKQKEEQELVEETISDNQDLNKGDEVSASSNQNAITVKNYQAPIPKTAVKLSDASYSNTLHKNYQSQVANLIENQKGACFFNAANIQQYIIKNCKATMINGVTQDCIDLEKQADTALKNCDTIFLMETKYDNVINEFINYSISEYVDITEEAILYIGAGATVAKKDHFTPTQTVETLPVGNSDQQMLGNLELPNPSDKAALVEL